MYRLYKFNKYQCEVKPTAQKSEPQKQTPCAEEELYQKSTAPTAFFVFLYEFRRLIAESCLKNLTQVEICRNAGKRWRQMTDEERQPYSVWARSNRDKLRGTMSTRKVISKRSQRRGRSTSSCR
uniref:HMG box domain-containing protein n=1 Tax=Glossina palpalis gambiensis TaxID=67801 RepID=A0A1B0C750_9MUSC